MNEIIAQIQQRITKLDQMANSLELEYDRTQDSNIETKLDKIYGCKTKLERAVQYIFEAAKELKI